jgi:hypothetical protein
MAVAGDKRKREPSAWQADPMFHVKQLRLFSLMGKDSSRGFDPLKGLHGLWS